MHKRTLRHRVAALAVATLLVTVVHLPEVGIRGNTHFLMSDLNNVQVADQLSQYLAQKGLDR